MALIDYQIIIYKNMTCNAKRLSFQKNTCIHIGPKKSVIKVNYSNKHYIKVFNKKL